jgi:hypothetical protein
MVMERVENETVRAFRYIKDHMEHHQARFDPTCNPPKPELRDDLPRYC